MLFNSLEFAVFFPTVCLLYFALPHRWRTILLLVASCMFYMAFIPAYILILLVTILIDYFAGIYLESTTGRTRRLILWTSIIATCLVLFVFKYFYFFTHTFVNVAGVFGWKISDWTLKIILPIGLSFHTFQSLSYVVEVYRGHQKTERDFITYATYVMFFPQLVAGPIERPQNLLHQFHEKHEFDYARVASGAKRMAWGFFKKLVVADRLAIYVNEVYGAPGNFNGLQLCVATLFFAYQIYCDFSGYSDIAIGSARILGFDLMENFNTPYYSSSVSEFWRRWHISLSTWFRDYVYLPLGGSRVSKPRWMGNIMITFGVSGLWHGASWTFVVWGLLNGVYLVCGALTEKLQDRIYNALGFGTTSFVRRAANVGITFVLISIAWVVFRANTIQDAVYVLSHFWRGWDFHAIRTEQFLLRQMPVAVGSVLLLEFGQALYQKISVEQVAARLPVPVRWATYVCLLLGITMLGVYAQTQFIYFQF